MRTLSYINKAALLLLLLGGLNWGLVGLFSIDLVGSIFGYGTFISRLIYILVGISAGYEIYWKFHTHPEFRHPFHPAH